jgi:dimethylglycine oxidase
MEDRTSVVIIGAGIVGCGVAEHVTRMGWQDMVVLDGGPLFKTGGSTSHAPGAMFQTNPSKTMTEFAKYTVRRYSELDLDGEPCFHRVGSIEVAATPERWKDLKRKQGLATSWGIESALISPEECVEKVPLIDPSKIYGGSSCPPTASPGNSGLARRWPGWPWTAAPGSTARRRSRASTSRVAG